MQLQLLTYRTDASVYIREIITRWFIKNLMWFVGILIVCVVLAATVDSAFLFVAAMLMFLVFPFVLAHVYLNYGLRPASVKWRTPKSVQVKSDGIHIHYMPESDSKRPLDDDFIPGNSLSAIKIGENSDVVYFGPNYDHFLIIDAGAFPGDNSGDERARDKFHEYIYQSIQRNCVNLRS